MKGQVVETPLTYSRWLTEIVGSPVYLKLENLQVTGSFKFRGALNALKWAKENEIERIFTASAGNHGLGVAEAAGLVKSDVTICLPRTASSFKRKKLAYYNVGLIEHGSDCEVTESYARRLAREKKAFYLSPYNNVEVMAGQGTIALEMLVSQPDLTCLVIPVGGGGLIGGIAVAAKAIKPSIRIIGVVAANSPVMKACVEAGRILPVFVDKTIADGLAGNIEADSLTFPIAREVVDEWVCVEEEDIASSIFEFLDNESMVVEGAGVVAVAAVKSKQIGVSANEKLAVVVSGSNIDKDLWYEICFSRIKEHSKK